MQAAEYLCCCRKDIESFEESRLRHEEMGLLGGQHGHIRHENTCVGCPIHADQATVTIEA